MTLEKIEKIRSVLKDIASDMESDAKNLDGKSFDGKNVGENFGYIMAAINSLAKIIEELLPEEEEV